MSDPVTTRVDRLTVGQSFEAASKTYLVIDRMLLRESVVIAAMQHDAPESVRLFRLPPGDTVRRVTTPNEVFEIYMGQLDRVRQ